MIDDFRSIVRGWLDLLRDPERVAASKAALDKALHAAEARGYERAKVQAPDAAWTTPPEIHLSARDGALFASGTRAASERIRAMKDVKP